VVPAEALTWERRSALRAERRRAIPLVKYVAGGHGTLVEEAVEEYAVVKADLVRSQLLAVRVRGTSMAPVIPDGAVIGLDLGDRQVVSGRVYVIRTSDGGHAVKQLVKDHRSIWCHSLNPSLDAPPFLLKIETGEPLPIIGRVVWVWMERSPAC
ncbi:MAG: helix-turn-helix transcriptional regulator, partial [Candidatus Methylomirabilales bacterium]